jgi:molybdopterin-containing oxidoreductase family iron-sulfur binding subunit
MVIDLKVCVGCHSCTAACKATNGTPPDIFFARVHEQEVGEYPDARREFLPVLCNHCEDPPCVEICPTGASYQRADGIVAVDGDVCIGCRSCALACPYDHRHYVDYSVLDTGYFAGDLSLYELAKYKRWKKGTVIKCDFCMDRVDKGQLPACVVTCPAEARHFGDLADPNSNVSRLLEQRDSFTLLPDAGTRPCVHYLKS